MTVRIAILGDHNPALPSHARIDEVLPTLGADVEARWWPTTAAAALDVTAVDGVWVAPGSPYADEPAVRELMRACRERGIPLIGTCGGLQQGVIEFVANALGRSATHAESDGVGADNVVTQLACSLRGELRWVVPTPGSRFAALVNGQPFLGLHFCGYGPTPGAVAELARSGWLVEAMAQDAPVEVLALASHPFYVLTLFQPQFFFAADGTAVPGMAHPLLANFVDVARAGAARRALAAHRAALALEDARPRPYVHQLRGATYRWWRPLLGLALTLGLWVLISIVLAIGFALSGSINLSSTTFDPTPGNNLYLNLTLAALIPSVFIGARFGMDRPWRRVLSVQGRFRWRWLGRCLLWLLPLWVAYLGLSWWFFDGTIGTPMTGWLPMLVVTLVTTPLQAAGEEVGFRGALVQLVGAWFARPWVAFVVSTVVSTLLFALAHGSLDPWIMLDIGSLGVAACWLAWRTGGLEAGIAIHVVNNLLITAQGILMGGLSDSYVTSDTTGSPATAGVSVLVMTAATALLDWRARRAGIAAAHPLSAPAVG